ncbi:hypothetical protein QBC38DRAFT_530303, partial [Podospora fimiseda]
SFLNISPTKRRLLKQAYNLNSDTLKSVLLLHDVFPLSTAFRIGMRNWALNHSRRSFRSERALASSSIIKRLMYTQGGENVLGLVLTFWKTQRYSSTLAVMEDAVDKKDKIVSWAPAEKQARKIRNLLIAWVAQLLSSLLNLIVVAASEIPSLHQLEIFVRCIIRGFKDKALTDLEVKPNLSFDLGKRHRFARQFLFWKKPGDEDMGIDDDDMEGIDVDEGFRNLRPASWDNTVTFTSRLLLQLRQIAKGDCSHIIVSSGPSSASVGFYAAIVLGLSVEFREPMPGGYARAHHPFRMNTDSSLDLPTSPDVIDTLKGSPEITELIKKTALTLYFSIIWTVHV